MCGVAGMYCARGLPSDAQSRLLRMLASIRHRGPDQHGHYVDDTAALGSVRLSIVDVAGGQQPIANDDGTLWIVFNGEVFNHPELRRELEADGVRCATRTDTEVVLRLYERHGPACLEKLCGQFAIAIWDARARRLFLARDRLGVRPLFYAFTPETLLFGSEVKALFNSGLLGRRLSKSDLCDVLTYWAPLPGRSAFEGVRELMPGNYMLVDAAGARVERYWQLHFGAASPRTEASAVEEFSSLLEDATRIRLRADVPVGAYLSGGLDSSVIASLAQREVRERLRTFSIAFTDAGFDEGAAQRRMAGFLGTEHQVVEATYGGIGEVFPDVVWHAEVPLLRTAPAPMFMLSRAVREAGYKVVLTGEGADEFLGGYDIFKEATVRAFWSRGPSSAWRAGLLGRLYPEIFGARNPGEGYLRAFFGSRLEDPDAPDFSHALRWRNTRRLWRFLDAEVAAAGAGSSLEALAPLLPSGFERLGVLERAQFLEATLFLPQYLLSSQGDRVALAHSVEGRFPFLDHRLVELCNRLPTRLKLRGLRDKRLLRKAARDLIPAEIAERRKQPFRAPIHGSFFHRDRPPYLSEVLSRASLRESGVFEPDRVERLCARLEGGGGIGETDDMALAAIISTQLLHRQFVSEFRYADARDLRGPAKQCRPSQARSTS